MGTLAHWLRRACDGFIAIVDGLGAFGALTAISVLTAALILVVVRYTTPASWIDKARNQIAAAIYEVRLFLDSPVRIIKAQGRLLGYSGVYIAALMPALILMSIPMGLLFLQLELRYSLVGVPTGEPQVVSIEVEGGTDDVSAEVGSWGRITAPLVRDPERGEAYLRLVVDEPGDHTLTIKAGSESTDKRVTAGKGEHGAPSPVRTTGTDLWWEYTGEPPLPGDRVQSIAIAYPRQSIDVLGMPWWLYWLLLSTVLALALRKPFKVTL